MNFLREAAKFSTRLELLFSTIVEMISSVTCGIRPSIHAAAQARASEIGVSVTSVYHKLNAMESNLRSVYGSEKIQQEVSSYYLADEIRGTDRGMMIAIPPKEWRFFAQMSLMELTNVLRDLATKVNLATFLRHPRSPKKARRKLKRTRPVKRPHVSTAKLLLQNKTTHDLEG